MAIRLALLGHHYRSVWDWSSAELERGAARLEAWRNAGAGSGSQATLLGEVRRRLDDDLDAPRALAVIDAEADAGRPVGEAAALLGVELW